MFFFFCKQKTAYEMRISDGSSDVCSSDLDAVGAVPRHDGLLDRHLALGATVQPAADLGILAFVVLANHPEVDVLWAAPRQGALHALHHSHRAEVDVLLHLAPDRDQQAPERHVVRDPGEADRAEEDGVGVLQPLQGSAGRRVGKEWGSTCSTLGVPWNKKNKKQ